MTLVAFTIPTAGLIFDHYEIEDTPDGVTIEHDLVEADGYSDGRCRATLMILPEALPRVVAELLRVQKERANV